MKALIIGNGQLGSYVYKHWDNFNNIQIDVVDYPDFDITSKNNCQKYVKKYDIIINCAAYTLVDKAEEQFDKCMKINSLGPMYLAKYCKKYNKKLIHISSEVVYGSNKTYYPALRETDECHPTNIYSVSKLNGDNNIQTIMNNNYIILRSGWLFGPNNDHNFIEKIKQLLLTKDEIKVVYDQVGSLTSVSLILNCIKDYLNNKIPDGLYNVANSGYASRYTNALFINNILKTNCKINKCSSEEFKRIANIAKNSCLDCSKLYKYITFKVSSWEDDVKKVLKGQM